MAEIDWMVLHVAQAEGDDEPFEPFCYTEGMFAKHGVANLWFPYLGACEHRVGQRMAHHLVNSVAEAWSVGAVSLGDPIDETTEAGATIRVVPFKVLNDDERRIAEAFPADGGPVVALSWSCSLDADWPVSRRKLRWRGMRSRGGRR